MSVEYDDKFNLFYETEQILPNSHIYAYVKFPSLERAEYGIYMTEGDPSDSEIKSESLGESTYDPTSIAPLTDFADAVEVLKDGDSLEEFPYVEISDEAQFNKLIESAGKDRENEFWEGPGVYIIAGSTYHRQYDSVERYQMEEMKAAADDLIEDLHSGEELQDAAEAMLDKIEAEHT